MQLDLGLFVLVFFFPGASGNPQLPSARPGLWLSLLSSSGRSLVLMLHCAPEYQGRLHPEGPCRVHLCKWQEPIYDSLGNVCVPHCQQRQRAEHGGVITNDNCPLHVVVTVVGDSLLKELKTNLVWGSGLRFSETCSPAAQPGGDTTCTLCSF